MPKQITAKRTATTAQSIIDIGNPCANGNLCLFNVLNDPFLLGKGSSLDPRFLEMIERLEVRIAEVRAALKKGQN